MTTMRDVFALWYVGQRSAADIVYAACDLLVSGLDGPALRELAAVSVHHADDEVPGLLEPALRNVGLAYHSKGTTAANEAALTVMAAQVLAGALPPRDLTVWVHRTFGHATLELAERLSDLDDVYDELDWSDLTEADVDAQVRAEAQRLMRIGSPATGQH